MIISKIRLFTITQYYSIIHIRIEPAYICLKGLDSEKRVWLGRVPRPSIIILWIYFPYLENCSIFERKCQLANPNKSDVGFLVRVTQHFYSVTRFFSLRRPKCASDILFVTELYEHLRKKLCLKSRVSLN